MTHFLLGKSTSNSPIKGISLLIKSVPIIYAPLHLPRVNENNDPPRQNIYSLPG